MASDAEFSETYRKAVDEIVALMPKDWSAIAKHNAAWSRDLFDARKYLLDSEGRFLRAYRILLSDKAMRVLDVGGFLGALPLTLARLGFKVSIAEKYGYYGGSLDAIAGHLQANGVIIHDVDFTDPAAGLAGLADSFDGITCMAVAEHLAHSPKVLMDNMRQVLKARGTLVFEVPNLAYWPKRILFFLKGRTVLPPMADVYNSAVPFTGHHREYTLEDARYVMEKGGFSIVSECTYNYGIDTGNVLETLKFMPALLFKEWAGIILMHGRKE